jgi:hypothetical protein
MKGSAKECIEWLQEKDLYASFIAIAKSSTTMEFNSVWPTPLMWEEAYAFLKSAEPNICKSIIDQKIKLLLYYGFLVYDGIDAPHVHNVKYNSNDGILDQIHDKFIFDYEQNHPICNTTLIRLSKDAEADISGCFIYSQILDEEADEKAKKSIEKAFSPIEKSYKKYVDKSKSELEKKINNIEDSTVKSIEIISIFSAIITLLLTNIIGVINLSKFGIKSLLLVNMSVVISIFFLLLFTRLLIREREKKHSLAIAIGLVALFIIMFLVLIHFVA